MDPDDKLSFNSEINAPSWLEGPLISIKVKNQPIRRRSIVSDHK